MDRRPREKELERATSDQKERGVREEASPVGKAVVGTVSPPSPAGGSAAPEEEAKKNNWPKPALVLSMYCLIWILLVALFWASFKPGEDAMGYGLLVFYFILPIDTMVLSALIGRDAERGRGRWVMVLFFGGMYMLAQYCTFTLATMRTHNVVLLPSLNMLAAGLLLSAVGMAIGAVLHKLAMQDKGGEES